MTMADNNINRKLYRRIVLVRTDRLGDVVLTTPAISAVRSAYPDAHIAMIVRPYTELVVRENPYLDECIVYDKDKKDKSVISSLRFAMELKKKNFDVAIIFHPTNRMHIITYLAKIPRRIGYDRKFPFLLTDRVPDTKHEGKKHERDYNFDLLGRIGVTSAQRQLYIPPNADAERFTDDILSKNNISPNERIVAMHPGASCPSKIWPSERFAKLADRIISAYRVKVLIIGGDDRRDIFCVNSVKKFMQEHAVFIAGGLNVLQLSALLKRACLFISNDSGPVHVATAMQTPVIAIFGRNQPGLSPKRWGPLGPNDVVLHKDVGCRGACLAHNCNKGFDCLSAISVDDVLSAIKAKGML